MLRRRLKHVSTSAASVTRMQASSSGAALRSSIGTMT
jgi:hypothetical protein